ncbi:hypothetical protein JHW43_004963 [Diplocarpon mali]|nr:hypothetical protein JHW43_004963 [Diplocarpon mali]
MHSSNRDIPSPFDVRERCTPRRAASEQQLPATHNHRVLNFRVSIEGRFRKTCCGPAPMGPPTDEFKGHSQPPPNERLTAARNFLGDEDPYRCLDFAARIDEIEEYVKHLEDGRVPCDLDLLHAVKVMAAAHREWDERSRGGPADTACSSSGEPKRLPYSTRLVSLETAANLKAEREAFGLNTQMREDHPPFSVLREDDHAQFLAAMNDAAAEDPDEVDPTSNLLWAEGRAYSWALQDPILIPFWMHPTEGIPKKGVRAGDPTPWYRATIPNPLAAERDRPARGWVPAYVLATEAEINRLLRDIAQLAPEEGLKLLPRLFSIIQFLEPPELRRLGAENAAFDAAEDAALKAGKDATEIFSPKERRERNRILAGLQAGRAKLIESLEPSVYLIVRLTRNESIEVSLPGVFYVDHGILGPARTEVLRRANELLQAAVAPFGMEDMSQDDLVAFDLFSQKSQRSDLGSYARERAAILQRVGANRSADLDYSDKKRFDELLEEEREDRRGWMNGLSNPEFRYLRPGEMESDDENLLYIPWEITTVPTVDSPIIIEQVIPANVQAIQRFLNNKLQVRPVPDVKDEIGFWIEVAPPDLRALAIPWLGWRRMENEGPLGPEDLRLQSNLDPIFRSAYKSWREGLGPDLIVKLPGPHMIPERPGILYRLSDDDDCAATDVGPIQKLLDLGQNRNPGEQDLLRKALIPFSYPALRRLRDDWQDALEAPTQNPAPCQDAWVATMNRWIRSMDGAQVELRSRPNLTLDPDNDPSVVYYRGPLRVESHYPRLDDKLREALSEHINGKEIPERFEKHTDLLAPVIREAYEVWKREQKPRDGAIYGYHVRALWSSFQPKFTPDVQIPGGLSQVGARPDAITDCPAECSPKSAALTMMRTEEYNVGEYTTTLQPQIDALENEINRLSRNLRIPPGRSFRQGSIRTEQRNEFRRLDVLLEQFRPCYIRKFGRQRTRVSYPGDRSEAAELESLNRSLTKAYVAWRRPIIQTGVVIHRGIRPVAGSKQLLEFQPHATNTGLAFRIKAPDLDSMEEPPPITEYDPADFAPQAVQSAIAANPHEIKSLELWINELLRKRAAGTISWDESENLLSGLRVIMPPHMANLEKAHYAVDSAARESNDPKRDRLFWESWDSWDKTYDDWIAGLPEGHVEIALPGTLSPDGMPLQIADTKSLDRPYRPQSLPFAVRDVEKKLNEYLYGAFSSLSTGERQNREAILWQFFRPIDNHARRLILQHIEREFSTGKLEPQNLTAEIAALVESLSLRCCAIYRDKLRSLRSRNVFIAEQVPGEYKLSHESFLVPGNPDATGATPELRIAASLVGLLCIADFRDTRAEFLDLTSKIRRYAPLSTDERRRLKARLELLATANLATMQVQSDTVARISIQHQTDKNWQSKAPLELLDADSVCLWYGWVLGSLDPSLRVLLNPPLPSLINTILQDGTRSQTPDRASQPARAASAFEIKALETEINNLLSRLEGRKAGSSTQEEAFTLLYLLRELLPPVLRVLKLQNDRRLAGLIDPAGSIISGLASVESQKEFETRYRDYLTSLPRLGVVLDLWWYSDAEINAACARWRDLKEMFLNPDGTTKYPITPLQIENQQQRRWFEQYAVLIDYVDQGCVATADANVVEQLLISKAPDVLRDLEREIRVTTAALAAGDVDGTAFLIGIKEDFVRSYIDWYTKQSPQVILDLRGAGPVAGKTIDFTGKAERRGIQRAAIELALNLLASNQEQHRPADRFRIIDTARQYVPLPDEVSISLPLELSRRQIDPDTFEYTKKMSAYREWKDFDYELSRGRLIRDHATLQARTGVPDPDVMALDDAESTEIAAHYLYPPVNYMGPVAAADSTDWMKVRRERHAELSRIALRLSDAYTRAPRPLLQRLLVVINEGMLDNNRDHPLSDNVPLDRRGLDLLEEISGDSWAEGRIEYSPPLEIEQHNEGEPHFVSRPAEVPLAVMLEFEEYLVKLPNLPFWVPLPDDPALASADPAVLRQPRHLEAIKSTLGLTLNEVQSAQPIHRPGKEIWTLGEIHGFLKLMKQHGRVQQRLGGWEGLSDPLGGPSREQICDFEKKRTTLIRRPPIVQPNKEDHLQQLAYRLGRDICGVLRDLCEPFLSPGDAIQEQYRALECGMREMTEVTSADRGQIEATLVDPQTITLQRLAREAIATTPGLAIEAGLDGTDAITLPEAAAVIQIKTLQEISDNFEAQLPKTDDVWDFASDRLEEATEEIDGRKITTKPRLTQFFSMRRYPVCCQSQTTRAAIQSSGPVMADKVQVNAAPGVATTARPGVSSEPDSELRHIHGQVPHYPFGETPYQEAYQSHVMEYELRDVPEFQPQEPEYSWYNPYRYIPRARTAPITLGPEPETEDPPIPDDPYPLPRIPRGWVPENISKEEQRLRLIEKVRETPGFPTLPEYYYTQDEIEAIDAREKFAEQARQVQESTRLMEAFTRKPAAQMTREDIVRAQKALGINARTGFVDPKLTPTLPPTESRLARIYSAIGFGPSTSTVPPAPGPPVAQLATVRNTNSTTSAVTPAAPPGRQALATPSASSAESSMMTDLPAEETTLVDQTQIFQGQTENEFQADQQAQADQETEAAQLQVDQQITAQLDAEIRKARRPDATRLDEPTLRDAPKTPPERSGSDAQGDRQDLSKLQAEARSIIAKQRLEEENSRADALRGMERSSGGHAPVRRSERRVRFHPNPDS